ncbi:hypothetical protein UFOVP1328_52 [uncultured Caudovirales phage]|uniref:Uncharacterized protein n=1 Tax=uncultured Caudovirales phage TaxID=2100421 RepID=A0A6J7XE77_9CAUD|nr:hypothetical protein UFOVP1084_26 [uncultured Caudovirales phage]CAB4199526.1 hypothetical protein UFOVP1328_52 [uncultured Caudovirales phage]CAB5228328.1 hypothetical protein UFOVP1532_20 [uncultured Caudovirales phage]
MYDDEAKHFDDVYDAMLDMLDADGRAVILMIPGPVGVHVVHSRMPKTGLQWAYNEDERERARFQIGLHMKARDVYDLPKDELSEDDDDFAEYEEIEEDDA